MLLPIPMNNVQSASVLPFIYKSPGLETALSKLVHLARWDQALNVKHCKHDCSFEILVPLPSAVQTLLPLNDLFVLPLQDAPSAIPILKISDRVTGRLRESTYSCMQRVP